MSTRKRPIWNPTATAHPGRRDLDAQVGVHNVDRERVERHFPFDFRKGPD